MNAKLVTLGGLVQKFGELIHDKTGERLCIFRNQLRTKKVEKQTKLNDIEEVWKPHLHARPCRELHTQTQVPFPFMSCNKAQIYGKKCNNLVIHEGAGLKTDSKHRQLRDSKKP